MDGGERPWMVHPPPPLGPSPAPSPMRVIRAPRAKYV